MLAAQIYIKYFTPIIAIQKGRSDFPMHLIRVLIDAFIEIVVMEISRWIHSSANLVAVTCKRKIKLK